MLGLADEVGGHVHRVGGRIRDDHDLGRSRRHVDGAAVEDLELGLRDPGAAGAHDLVHRLDRLGAVCERGDRLRTAHDVQLLDLHQAGRAQERRRDRAIAAGRGRHDELPDTREPGRDGAHEQRRGQGSAATWDVRRDPVKAPPDATDVDARAHLDPLLRGGHLDGVEAFDVAGHLVEAAAKVTGQPVTSVTQLGGRDGESRRCITDPWQATTEALGRIPQRGVATGPAPPR